MLTVLNSQIFEISQVFLVFFLIFLYGQLCIKLLDNQTGIIIPYLAKGRLQFSVFLLKPSFVSLLCFLRVMKKFIYALSLNSQIVLR